MSNLGRVLGFLGVLGLQSVMAETSSWSDPVTGIEFVRLPAGCFMMGENVSETRGERTLPPVQSPDEQPRHSKCMNEFWLAKTELTWRQWQKISGRSLPRNVRPQQAAYDISWEDAQSWVRQLNQASGVLQAHVFRLPTEAEWEYACRAGSTAEAFSGDLEALRKHQAQLTAVAWYRVPDFADRWSHDVGMKQSNAWGLHDMLGNVYEWVEDAYFADAYKRTKDPVPPQGGERDLRGIRGGSYRSYDNAVRCGARNALGEQERLPVVGMRLVMERRGAK